MTITEKLDILMKMNNLNKRTFSKAANIPYTTVAAFYEKGTKNMKLSTLKKICECFNISYDAFINEAIEICVPTEYFIETRVIEGTQHLSLPKISV